MSPTLFGPCSCASIRGRFRRNMMQAITGYAPFDFFKPPMGGQHEYYWSDPVYLTATETLHYDDGFSQDVTFSFDSDTATLSSSGALVSGPGLQYVVTLAVCGFGGSYRAYGTSSVGAYVATHYNDAYWIAKGYTPAPSPPYYPPVPITSQTEALSGVYHFKDAAAKAMAQLARGSLMNPGRLYTDSQTGQQAQLGYPTDAIVPGSVGVCQNVAFYNDGLSYASTNTYGGCRIGAYGLGTGSNLIFPASAAYANPYSPVFGTVHDGSGYPIPDLSLLLGGTGWASATATAVFCSDPFMESSQAEGLVATPPTYRHAGEYVYTPQDAGDTWMNTTPALPTLSPRATWYQLTSV